MIKMAYDKATAIRIRDYLLSKGLTVEGTYGMLANIYSESGFRSNNAQNSYMTKMGMTDESYTAQVDSGAYTDFCVDKVGYGLCQWTSSGRKLGLFNYAVSTNKSIGDERMQLEYLIIELTTAYKSVLNFLKSSNNIRESAKYVMTKFERPADQSESAQNKRADYGEQLYKDLEEVKTMARNPKVFIGVGHGGSDPGAVKYVKEKDANLIMALACRDALIANDVDVCMSRTKDENDTLSEEIRECNAYNPDLAIDVHNNAAGGDGFEALVSINGGVGTTLARNIEVEVLKIGQNSRGLKTKKNSAGKDYYGFIRSTNCPAVILEGAFVDNATDVKIIDTIAEQQEFGRAYARGILKTLKDMGKLKDVVEQSKEEPKVESKDVLYKVQCGAFSKRENAEALRKKLKADGYDAMIVEVKK